MIDLDEFSRKRPYLYHLTAASNVPGIRDDGIIFSTKSIVEQARLKDRALFLRTRRPQHVSLKVGTREILVRDQRPISMKALGKCVIDGINAEEFIELINQRVFMWPTIERLERHFKRYEHESPVILRFLSKDLIRVNGQAEFSSLNSGATRPSYHLGGIAPPRGRGTFQVASRYEKKIATIAEVTFPLECRLPHTYSVSSDPNGQWKTITSRGRTP